MGEGTQYLVEEHEKVHRELKPFSGAMGYNRFPSFLAVATQMHDKLEVNRSVPRVSHKIVHAHHLLVDDLIGWSVSHDQSMI